MRPAQLVGTHAWRSYEATRRYLITSGSALRAPPVRGHNNCITTADDFPRRLYTRST